MMEFYRTVVRNGTTGETELIVWQSSKFELCLEHARTIMYQTKINPAQIDILFLNKAGLWESIWGEGGMA